MKLPNLSVFIDEHIITEVFTREGLVFSHAGCACAEKVKTCYSLPLPIHETAIRTTK